jgi:Na+/proline symporter
MGPAPQTRLARAKADWRGFQGARDTLNLIAGAALAVAALFLAGFPHDAIVTILTIACTAVVGAVVLPAIDFGLCWYRAPLRIRLALEAESQKQKEQADAAKAAEIEARTTLRKLLLDY